MIAPATDDAPFLYFKGGSFPRSIRLRCSLILLMSLLAVRTLGGPLRDMRPYADLFFMGAAFLLLETKNVATFALLFGTTWFVNALVFAGVLVVVLAAVETTRKFRTPPLPVVYAGIAASLALAWVIRPEWLLPLPFVPRLLAATLLAFLPIYLANVAFSKRFAELVGLAGGVRDQPAGRDRRRLPGVCRAADRLRQPADRDGPALPRGFPADAQDRRSSRMTGRA